MSCSLHTANDIYADVAVAELQMKVDILQARKAAILARSDSPPAGGGAGGSGISAR